MNKKEKTPKNQDKQRAEGHKSLFKEENNKKESKGFPKKKKAAFILKALSSTVKFIGKIAFIFTVTLFFTASLFSIGIYYKYSKDFQNAKPKNGSTQAIFYDKNSSVIYEGFGTGNSDYISLNDIPDVIKKSTLAAEDIDFYKHGPINIKGILRAAYRNYQSSDHNGILRLLSLFDEKAYTEGGSSITQQLAKNRYLESDRSFERKIKELVYSYELEQKLSKDQILEEYLNYIYYGEQSLGIRNAAKIYFNKDVKNLDLAEASMLAGLPAAPSKYSAISGEYKESKKRQEYVLQQMIKAKFITLDEAKKAIRKPLSLSGAKKTVMKYPYFAQYVKQELINLYGPELVEEGGIKVYTSLDPKKQKVAEKKAKEYVEKFTYSNVSNAAVVIMENKTNNILAMVGGVDWEKSKVNVATSSRQPGSSFKPIVYATGFKEGYSPATKLLDVFVNFGGNPPYIPRNYSGGHWGNVSVRTALANSLNIPAVEMTQLAGVDKVIDTARTMGISTINGTSSDYGLSIGLGSAEVKLLDLVGAYSTLADNGKRTAPSAIVKVLNNKGENIYHVKRQKKTVLDPRVAYMVTSILSDSKARQRVFGYGNKLEIQGHTVAAKTGTTDNYTDSWTMGYNPDLTVGVWMGNNDRSQMRVISGIEGAAYIWHDIFEELLKNTKDKLFKKPRGLKEKWISPYTFSPAKYQGPPNILEPFIPGKELAENPDFSYLDQFRSYKSYSKTYKRW